MLCPVPTRNPEFPLTMTCELLDRNYPTLAQWWRQLLLLFIPKGRKKKKQQHSLGWITQITHKAGEVCVTYVLHTPFQSKWIYSFLLNLAWPLFPICQSSYRACDYFSFSRPNYSFLNFGDMAAAQVFLVKMIFICPLYFIYFPLWLHSYKSNTQN